MKQLLELIIKSIVNNPDEVMIDERESVDFPGLVILSISVSEQDKGVVIGKRGRTINAIRDIITISAIRANKRVKVLVNEEGDSQHEESHNHANTPAPEVNHNTKEDMSSDDAENMLTDEM